MHRHIRSDRAGPAPMSAGQAILAEQRREEMEKRRRSAARSSKRRTPSLRRNQNQSSLGGRRAATRSSIRSRDYTPVRSGPRHTQPAASAGEDYIDVVGSDDDDATIEYDLDDTAPIASTSNQSSHLRSSGERGVLVELGVAGQRQISRLSTSELRRNARRWIVEQTHLDDENNPNDSEDDDEPYLPDSHGKKVSFGDVPPHRKKSEILRPYTGRVKRDRARIARIRTIARRPTTETVLAPEGGVVEEILAVGEADDGERLCLVKWKLEPEPTWEPEAGLAVAYAQVKYFYDNYYPSGKMTIKPLEKGGAAGNFRHNQENWVELERVLRNINAFRNSGSYKFNHPVLGLDSNNLQQESTGETHILVVLHKLHFYTILFNAELRCGYLSDGFNEALDSEETFNELCHIVDFPLKPLRFQQTVRADHCASAAVAIALEFIRLFNRGDLNIASSVDPPRRLLKSIAEKLHRFKSQPTAAWKPIDERQRGRFACSRIGCTFKRWCRKSVGLHEKQCRHDRAS